MMAVNETALIYRTRKMAGETERVPDYIMLPSLSKYRAALSFREDGKDYVVPLRQELMIRYDEATGAFYYDDVELDMDNLDDAREQDLSGIDLWALRVMYSIIGKSMTEEFNNGTLTKRVIEHSVKVRVPDLVNALCSKGNVSKERAVAALNKIMRFKNAAGIIYEYDSRRKREWRSFYPLLLWTAIEEKDNTIRFTSPYINMLLYKIMEESVRVDRHGNKKRKSSGKLLFEAHHSYLVKSSIARERNKRAAEIVRIVCVLIEEAGDHGTAHISAQTILDRHAELAAALDAMNGYPSNQNRLLKSTFTKAWELLHTQTKLEEVYKDIVFPSTFPTMSTLNMSFEFPHDGKN